MLSNVMGGRGKLCVMTERKGIVDRLGTHEGNSHDSEKSDARVRRK